MAHQLFAQVRALFEGRCGYCGVAETDCGGELTVDHFRPKSAGGDDAPDNLVYACHRCNNYKGEFVPTPADEEHGKRVLHPLRESLALHVVLNTQTGELQALSPTGRFHIDLLHLNRAALVRHRLRARLIELSSAETRLLKEENQRFAKAIEAYKEIIAGLRQKLGLPPD